MKIHSLVASSKAELRENVRTLPRPARKPAIQRISGGGFDRTISSRPLAFAADAVSPTEKEKRVHSDLES